MLRPLFTVPVTLSGTLRIGIPAGGRGRLLWWRSRAPRFWRAVPSGIHWFGTWRTQRFIRHEESSRFFLFASLAKPGTDAGVFQAGRRLLLDDK
jgi:hypothetical protein